MDLPSLPCSVFSWHFHSLTYGLKQAINQSLQASIPQPYTADSLLPLRSLAISVPAKASLILDYVRDLFAEA